MQNQDNVKSTLKSIQLDNLKNKYSFYFNKKHFQSSDISPTPKDFRKFWLSTSAAPLGQSWDLYIRQHSILFIHSVLFCFHFLLLVDTVSLSNRDYHAAGNTHADEKAWSIANRL